jgi:hypothetical protein
MNDLAVIPVNKSRDIEIYKRRGAFNISGLQLN